MIDIKITPSPYGTWEYVPVGGRALTAEQVEDVEALVATANPYSAPAVRLRALFPATEPAEPAASEGVNCGANSVVLGWCTLSAQHEGLHTNGTYFWGQAPAPAEPAEEETKAGPWTVQLPEGMTTEQWIESLPDEAPGLLAAVREVRERLGISSPVVPAPTETGPWQRIEDVPEGVLQIKDRHGRTWLVVGGTWRFEWHDGNWHEPHTNINAQAPFVAAAEEG